MEEDLFFRLSNPDPEAPAQEIEEGFEDLARKCVLDMANAPQARPVLIRYFRQLLAARRDVA